MTMGTWMPRERSSRQTSKPSRPRTGGGELDGGPGKPGGALLGTALEPVPPRKHDAQEDEVEQFSQGPSEPRLAVAGGLDQEAFAEQPVGEREHEAGLVLHQ